MYVCGRLCGGPFLELRGHFSFWNLSHFFFLALPLVLLFGWWARSWHSRCRPSFFSFCCPCPHSEVVTYLCLMLLLRINIKVIIGAVDLFFCCVLHLHQTNFLHHRPTHLSAWSMRTVRGKRRGGTIAYWSVCGVAGDFHCMYCHCQSFSCGNMFFAFLFPEKKAK